MGEHKHSGEWVPKWGAPGAKYLCGTCSAHICTDCGTREVWPYSDDGYCKRCHVKSGLSDKTEIDVEELNTLRAQNARLRDAAEECLSVMEIQEKRSEGLFHLAAHAFVPLWTRAKESARRALEEG